MNTYNISNKEVNNTSCIEEEQSKVIYEHMDKHIHLRIMGLL